jgi:hypothetical protein
VNWMRGANPSRVGIVKWSLEWVGINSCVLQTFFSAQLTYSTARVLRKLLADGVVVVAGAGNTPGPIRGYPARFGVRTDANYMEDLIVVGGVSASRYKRYFRIDILSLYATFGKSKSHPVGSSVPNKITSRAGSIFKTKQASSLV